MSLFPFLSLAVELALIHPTGAGRCAKLGLQKGKAPFLFSHVGA